MTEEALERAKVAAEFLRGNRDAAPASAAIHLRLKGFRDTPEPDGRALVAWKVFALALAELDALDAAEKAAKEAGKQTADTAGYGHRGKSPFDATAGGPFDPTGFRPS